MLKFKTLKNRKGFTLVEMLVILMIIGVIVAVLVGIMGNPVTEATKDGAVAKTGDDMRALKDAIDLHMVRGNAEPTAFSELLTAGIITQILVPSKNAGSGAAYTLDKTYTAWGTNAADVAIVLAGVKDDICDAFNVKYAGIAENTPPAAISGAIGSQCIAGEGPGNRTIVWPVIVN